jgi:hypothetical protein
MQPAQAVWIRQDVHLDDFPSRNRKSNHRQQPPVGEASDDANIAVDEDDALRPSDPS